MATKTPAKRKRLPPIKKPKIHLAPTFINAGDKLERLPNERLKEVLETSGNAKMVNLCLLLQQARYDDYTMAEMCAITGVHLKEVAQVFKEQQLALGVIRQAKHTPVVLESNAQAAQGRRVPCPTCKGTGVFGEPLDGEIQPKCQTCNGERWVTQAGDAVALKIFAESVGLTSKSGPMVNINQNFGGAAGSFEDLMRQAEKRPAKIIEGVAE